MKIKFSQSAYFMSVISPFLIVLLSLAGIILLQYSGVQKKENKLTQAEYQAQEKEEKLQLKFLNKTPTLGFGNVFADWNYLKFIQYFGDDEAREKTGYSLVPEYFSLVVDRDPRFIDALIPLEVATSLFAALPQKSVDLLGQALQHIPPKLITRIAPYYLWRAKGNDELLFLGDNQAAIESYAKSIVWAKSSNDEDSQKIINISKNSINFLEKNPDSKIARIGAWVSVLSNRPDPKTVKRVIQEIEILGGKVIISPHGNITIQVPQNSN
jgi:hypothetical protein